MTTPLYEIVEIDEGVYTLQRSDSDEEPVVTIRFSSEAIDFLNSARGEVAKSMIEAGIQRVEMMAEDEDVELEQSADVDPGKTIH